MIYPTDRRSRWARALRRRHALQPHPRRGAKTRADGMRVGWLDRLLPVKDHARHTTKARTPSFRRVLLFGLSLTVLTSALAACNRSPEAVKARHLERGDRFYAKKAYREAVLEYLNVLRVEVDHPHAIRRVGFSLYETGEFAKSHVFLLKAEQQNPDDVETRLKLARIYLAARRLKEARAEAAVVLAKEPTNLDAIVVHAGAANTPEEIQESLQQLELMRAVHDRESRFHMVLGLLHLQRGDLLTAERSLTTAISLDPTLPEARLALAEFHMRRGDRAKAEEAFKAAADLAGPGSPARMRLAQFYTWMKKPDDAKRVLREATTTTPKFLPAWRMLAEIALAEHDYPGAEAALAGLLKQKSDDLDGQVLKARVHLAKRETNQAIQTLQKVVKVEPRLAAARYYLALAQVQTDNVQQARQEAQEAIKIAPGYADARVLLARLNIQAGTPRLAIEDLQKLVAANPRLAPAWRVLGSAHLAQRQPAKAVEAYRKLVALTPDDAGAHNLLGVALRAHGKPADAGRSFAKALELSPGLVEPLARLVTLDFAAKQSDAALARVRKQLVAHPDSAAHQNLLGRVHLARGERDQAEAAWLKALELDPSVGDAYLRLARLYAERGQHDEAIARLEKAVSVNPRDLRALLLAATVHQQRGDIARAREAYEKALVLRPRLAAAANNLAYLISTHGGDQDQERALELAQRAREIAPDDPQIADTLAWILHKRGVHQRALALLQESVQKVPESPEIQYHLGMVYLKVGDKARARRALELATATPAAFHGKDEAKRALAELR